MFEEIPTAETARIRLTFRELKTFVLQFREAEASFHKAVGELERTQRSSAQVTESLHHALTEIDQAVAKVVADLNQNAIWEERFKRLGEEVHFNGYAALATLVDDSRNAHEEQFSKMLLNAGDRFEALIENLAAAVDGKPPLPAMPHNASVGQKTIISVKRAFVRCRRWCIDVTAPARIVTIALLLILMLQNCFWHHVTH